MPRLNFLGTLELGLQIPGAVDGQKIKLFINKMVHGGFGDPEIEKLAIPVSMKESEYAFNL